ncbi:MAG TPA: protein kinase [Ornithinimicrobium sp.]|uniref:serine/threonine protein kinase n=1 Tax=Ornithinimicrobium sp. TaxID=1977084 RepID=UPI002B48CA63|nr:protein kinase [Ornithinimicrobium sp.]HKJ11922.1 protein kinase [Ornithinimicrobium sp.]
MTREADIDPDLRRPMPSAEPPVVPGYELSVAGRPVRPAPGVYRWRARRRADGLEVAVTCLRLPTAPQAYAAATKLATTLSRVHHPHVVPVRDMVSWPPQRQERFGLALITPGDEAESLDSVLRRRGALPAGQAISVLCPVAEALQALHEHGIVHGALTSSCVHLRRSGMPMVADAGAHVCTGQSPSPTWVREGYVAPEVLEGFPVTPQSDAYALAALVWNTLHGQAPTRAGGGSHAEAGAEDGPAAATLPAWLPEMLRHGLGSDPEARPKVQEWLEALPRLGSPAPVDLLVDMADELPRRLRAWARQSPRPDGSDPDTSPRRHRSAGRRLRARRGSGPGPVTGQTPAAARGIPLTLRLRVAVTLLIMAAVVAAAAVLVRSLSSVSAAVPEESASATAAQGRKPTPSPPAAREQTAPESASTAGPKSPSDVLATVQSLLDARGRAWESGSVADLEGASLVGSPAWQADHEDLQAALDERLDFTRVRFRAGEARVVSSATASRAADHPPEKLVRTRVRRGTVELLDAQGEQHRYPASTETVLLTLRRGEEGWRLYAWD